jgi:hypothetical protein
LGVSGEWTWSVNLVGWRIHELNKESSHCGCTSGHNELAIIGSEQLNTRRSYTTGHYGAFLQSAV